LPFGRVSRTAALIDGHNIILQSRVDVRVTTFFCPDEDHNVATERSRLNDKYSKCYMKSKTQK